MPRRTVARDAIGWDTLSFLALASRGTEPMLCEELEALGASAPEVVPGGVRFAGPIGLGLRVTLWSRIAMRVLVRLGEGPAPGPSRLYDTVRALPIGAWFSPDHTLSVHAKIADAPGAEGLNHSKYAALKVKDAIVDALRDAHGRRPDVDRAPDISVVVHIREGRATLYLDLAGPPLNQRGYRRRDVDAPLKENVAAALLHYSGWDGKAPLHDPTCGSGTIAIEAGLIATNAAPGLGRGFAFERWPTFDAFAATWASLRDEAQQVRKAAVRGVIIGSDRDPKAVAATRANMAVAGLRGVIVRAGDARDAQPLLGGGFFVFNPPYGERIGGSAERIGPFYDALGDHLRAFADHTVAVITTEKALRGRFGGPPERSTPVLNGPLRCEMAVFKPFAEPS